MYYEHLKQKHAKYEHARQDFPITEVSRTERICYWFKSSREHFRIRLSEALASGAMSHCEYETSGTPHQRLINYL